MLIAILGGTFDPIHNGHLAAAHSVAETFQVDELHFVPAFTPPHKTGLGLTSPFHRFSMVALARSSSGCAVSTSRTVHPACANTWAMPLPIVPAPTIPTVLIKMIVQGFATKTRTHEE